ncbi:hypothetical protein HPB50_006238 [Hyalomma asiaticum]|uniref:Uncharacterized protein n=1 Tax=Hyalomma asiaticum TaxID=266040 RepID=A0ACB7TF16_HYAAI|nr:hypothetical protein HPB50_006238 [Hyalomma asiaticum]
MSEMRSRLDRLEKLLEESLTARDPVREMTQTCPTRPLPRDNVVSATSRKSFSHFSRDCNQFRRRLWNTGGDRHVPENRNDKETTPRTLDQGN